MEKYIIILVILATIYYIQNKFLIEGFEAASAQSLGGVDDTNAINTLAQISKQLMAGSLTVPGNITLQGDLIFPEANTIVGKKRLHIGGEELLFILNKAGVIIGKEWGGNGNLTVQGNLGVGGNINLANDIHTVGSLSSIGPDKKNKVCLHTPPDGRRALYIAPQKLDGTDWEWGNALALDFKEKNFYTNSNNLIVGGKLVIGGATLSWDAGKNMLVLDKGLIVNNGLAPGNKTPGLITNNIIFGPSGAPATNDTNNQGGIENLLTTPLKPGWIPDFSSLLGPIRGDSAWTQRWGAIKYPGDGILATYKDISWYGQWTK